MQNSVYLPKRETPIEETYDSFELIFGSLKSTDSRYISSIQHQIQNGDEYDLINIQFKLVLNELLSSYKIKELFTELVQGRLKLVLFELLNRRKIKMWEAFENAFLQ